jgi:hypothetical protein
MTLSQVLTRKRWLLKAHNQHIVVVRGNRERFVHPLMKALIWALYLPDYPNSTIEVRIGDRYKPDVVAFAPDDVRFRDNEPIFWGEAGQVGRAKIEALVRRYPDTHFAIGKWNTRLRPHTDIISKALEGVKRNAPFDLISFPEHSADFIDDDGMIHISHDDLSWQRL